MVTGIELLREHRYKELWNKYCGFLDLSMAGFMDIQRSLLLEQLELLRGCELGRLVMNDAKPRTVDEFRRQVPLTTYADYAPYFERGEEDILPAKAVLWQRTSGMGGEYESKWAPMTARMYEEIRSVLFAGLILATCKRKYDINLDDEPNILYAMAPPPYATGCWARLATEELPLHFLPSPEEAENMTFEDRLHEGFRLAMSEGLDVVFGLPGVLVAMGEQLGRSSQGWNLMSHITQPRLLLRMGMGLLKSKVARRPLLPKDIWKLRGVAIGGADSSSYRQRIREMWGQDPLDGYGCTEGQIIATQTWDRRGMTFVPNLNFLEFIPEDEHFRELIYPGYQPKTCLLDEVNPGEKYEVVITNLLGGAFVRYRLGDLVKFIAVRNHELDIDLPQMIFYARADGFIDLAGFTRLTEKVIGQAIEHAGLVCCNWLARGEGVDTPCLHLYLELEQANETHQGINTSEIETRIHVELKRLDSPYADLEEMLHLKPLKVTLLPHDSFQEYAKQQGYGEGDPRRIRSARLNPPNSVIESLMDRARSQPTPAHS